MGGFKNTQNPQNQRSKPKSIKLVKNVAWMRVGDSVPACNMAVANPCTGASEMPSVGQQAHMV